MLNFARNLVLTCGELFDGLPQRCEILNHLLHLRRVEGGSGGRFGRDRCRRSLRHGFHLREGCRRLRPTELLNPVRDHLLGLRRPAKFRGRCRDYLFGCLTVGLPSQGASDTNADRDQVTNERPRLLAWLSGVLFAWLSGALFASIARRFCRSSEERGMVFVRAYDWEPATGLGFRALSSAWEPGDGPKAKRSPFQSSPVPD